MIRKKKITGLLGLLLVVLTFLYWSQWTDLRDRKLLVIVDMEPAAYVLILGAGYVQIGGGGATDFMPALYASRVNV